MSSQPTAPIDRAAGDELFSVVDADGRALGVERRSVCHQRPDLIHRSVSVMVVNGHGDLFLQLRSGSKDVHPGRWDTSCSGHCGADEDDAKAARRELDEELGVAGLDLKPFWRRLSGTATETELVQTCVVRHDGPFRLEPDEIADGRFWTRDEFLASLGKGVFTPHLEEEGRRLLLGAAWPKAVGLDLDGTVLDRDSEPAEVTAETLHRVRARGVRVFIATGRTPQTARPKIERIGLGEPAICSDGAVVVGPHAREILHDEAMPADLVRQVVLAIRAMAPDTAVTLDCGDRRYMDEATAAFLEDWRQYARATEIGDIERFLDRPVSRMFASKLSGGLVLDLEAMVLGRFGAEVQTCLMGSRRFLEVVRRGVSKGEALARLLAEAEIDPGDAMAMGDDMNDATMFAVVGRSVAMGNAVDELKRLADDVGPPHDALGVAHALEKYILSVPPEGFEAFLDEVIG